MCVMDSIVMLTSAIAVIAVVARVFAEAFFAPAIAMIPLGQHVPPQHAPAQDRPAE
jgi:hypothetical protein